MKIIYIAHPIGGDVTNNLERIKNIVRELNLTDCSIVPFAPYWVDCHALNDNNPDERARGIKNDIAFFEKGVIDEVWLYGGRISNGMQAEIELATRLNIPVIDKENCFKK